MCLVLGVRTPITLQYLNSENVSQFSAAADEMRERHNRIQVRHIVKLFAVTYRHTLFASNQNHINEITFKFAYKIIWR